MKENDALAALRERLEDVQNLRATSALLQWDEEVCMPPKGAPARARHLATVSALAHERFTAPEIGVLIERAREDEDGLTEDDRALLREVDYDYRRAVRIPGEFTRRCAKARSHAYHAWVEARKAKNFAAFLPHLDALVALAREEAEYLGYAVSPYDALLEQYERGMTVDLLRPLFQELAKKQSALAARIVESPNQPDLAWMDQDWDLDRQWAFTERVLRDMGYDFEAGRQDKAVHPFTTGFSIHDVRITTRLNLREPFSALYSSIHEGGHALYEQGHRLEDEGTILASAPSLGMHESQSRYWENVIGRSLPFWRHYAPVLRTFFPGQLDGVSAEQICAAVNRVAPSLIRVEADECTYNLHVIMRFELETALIEGDLAPADVPAAWNEKMRRYLRLDPPDDGVGCLQDVHWSGGMFGYFPTYALGNLYAAQLSRAMASAVPGLWEHVEKGNFAPILDWLRVHIHRVGRRQTAPEIIRAVTGAEPTPQAFLDYLESKYAILYAL